MARRRILIVDDEEGVRTSLGMILADEGYATATAPDAAAALDALREHPFHAVLCDVRMPRRSGLDLLPEIVALQPDAIVLIMSAYSDVDHAIQAVQRGASDYLAKPFQADELLLSLRKAEERARLERENRHLRRELRNTRTTRGLIAASDLMKRVVELVERAAEHKTTVLITGESGVGKEVVARTIHELSDRAREPFIAVNCGAIPESLIESELFGHARGAFTGASEAKPGLFREANGGTLFLDEVGELPLTMQVKLLRALQEEEVRPVGEPRPIRVDVRIVAATARELESAVEAGEFRPDLFYRLNVLRILVPPLRERPDDIPVLADHLLDQLAARIGKRVQPVRGAALEALLQYAWPGNVRELENCLERALILTRCDELTADILAFPRGPSAAATSGEAGAPRTGDWAGEDLSIKRRGRALEEHLIRRALSRTSGNRTHAARILEISARALHYKIKEYGIEPLNPLLDDTDTDKT
jgi:two-component system, NtrC family, response regulator AtoC